ncbi:MAG: AraC family transcriptional regulator [Clostridia bacterium]|nr:AraC family transcriptional regulator [Clostridia bacterium]
MRIYLENKDFTDLSPLEFGVEQKASGKSESARLCDYHTIHYIISGSGVFKKNNKTYKLSKGQCFLLRPGEIYTDTADTKTPWKYLWIGFSGKLSDSFSKLDDVFTPNASLFSEFNLAFSLDYGVEEFLVSMLFKLYCELLCSNRPADSVKKIISYINVNYMKDISISQIASEFNTSRTYLSRIFKERLGISIKQYIIEKRLYASKGLLKEGYSVYQTSKLVGYSDQFIFSKAFKKHFGYAPSKLKKS